MTGIKAPLTFTESCYRGFKCLQRKLSKYKTFSLPFKQHNIPMKWVGVNTSSILKKQITIIRVNNQQRGFAFWIAISQRHGALASLDELWKNYCKSLGASPVSHAHFTLLLSSEVALFMIRRFWKVTRCARVKTSLRRRRRRWHTIDNVNIALNLCPNTFHYDLGLEPNNAIMIRYLWLIPTIPFEEIY